MECIDEDGKWLIQAEVKMLIEPSEKWISENRPQFTQEQLHQQLTEKYNSRVEELITLNLLYSTQGMREAIFRKKIANVDTNGEFEAFNTFVEECKVQAKIELSIE